MKKSDARLSGPKCLFTRTLTFQEGTPHAKVDFISSTTHRRTMRQCESIQRMSNGASTMFKDSNNNNTAGSKVRISPCCSNVRIHTGLSTFCHEPPRDFLDASRSFETHVLGPLVLVGGRRPRPKNISALCTFVASGDSFLSDFGPHHHREPPRRPVVLGKSRWWSLALRETRTVLCRGAGSGDLRPGAWTAKICPSAPPLLAELQVWHQGKREC